MRLDTTPVTPAAVRAAIAPVLERLAASAAEREQRRDYAVADVQALAAAGVARIGLPVADGGAGGSLRDVVDVVVEIARADSSVAQALRHTFVAAYQVNTRPGLPHRDAILARLRHGDIVATTGHERSGGPHGSVGTTARREDDGWLVEGEKYYSTGSVYAHWFSAQAQAEDGTLVRFTVPVDRAGVERLDDFDAIGQRLTASGTTRLRGVRVEDDEVVVMGAPPPDNPWLGTYAQLHLAAIEAGIAVRVLDDARWYVIQRARPIKHSSAVRSADDPYVRRRVGQIATLARSARATVLVAAEVLDGVRGLGGAELHAAAADASVHVAEAGVVAMQAALQAAELLFDVGGGSITDRGLGFDRHWRNARTVANHNPRDWKLAVVGAYELGVEEPPTTGLF